MDSRAEILNRLRLQKSAATPAEQVASFDVTKPMPQIPDSQRSPEWQENFAKLNQPVNAEAEQAEMAKSNTEWGDKLQNRATAGWLAQQAPNFFEDLATQARNKFSQAGGNLLTNASGAFDRFQQQAKEGLMKKPDIAGELAGQITKTNPNMLAPGTPSSPLYAEISKNWGLGDKFKFAQGMYKTNPEGTRDYAWMQAKNWMKTNWPMLAAGGIGLAGLIALISTRHREPEEAAPQAKGPFNYARLMGVYR